MNDKIICSHCGGNMHKVWFKEKEYKDYGKMSEANWNRVIEEIERKIRKHIGEEYRKTLSYNGQKEKERQER